MQQWTIRLHRRIFEICAVIRCIASKFYTGGINVLAFCKQIGAHLKKSAHVECGSSLETSCKTAKETHAGGNEKLILRSTLRDTREKFDSCEVNRTVLEQNAVSNLFTRYRKIGEMDLDGDTSLPVQSFDDMTLEDIDYVIL